MIEFIRQFKIFEYAIFDLTVSYLGIYLLSPLLSKLFRLIRIEIPKINWVILTLPISILVHMMVGNFTPMTNNFLNLNDYYLLKIIILGMLILGIRGIKIIKNK